MSFILAASAVISAGIGVYKVIDGAKKAKAAKAEQAIAQAEYEKNKEMFKNLDTSNPYLNMENVMEDLTVDRQAAEFTRQQQMQSQANIMQQMRGAAGGSGIAALAQTMAGQGALDAQRAAASIGQQERANQMAERQETGRLQGMERQGEVYSRGQEQMKVQGLLGMSQGELASAKAERAAAQQQIISGVGDIAGAVGSYGEARMKYGKPPGMRDAGDTGMEKYWHMGGEQIGDVPDSQKYLNDGSVNPNYKE